MTISKVDLLSFITELVTRNPNLGIPALEDGLFANLLIFDYSYYISFKREGKREGKREEEKGREKGREKEREKGREKGRVNHLYCSAGRDKGQTPLQNCSGW